jgi:hypothetical protein
METLAPQFTRAVQNVTISGPKLERAIAAHLEVRALLESDEQMREWGIDTILIGSYARKTARYPGKDVDVFLRFAELSVRYDPIKVFSAVERILLAHYGSVLEGGRATVQARSVKIDFHDSEMPGSDGDFSVDAVPAVPWGEHWGIPNRDRDLWNQDEARWIQTSPIQFADETVALSVAKDSPTVDGDNAYRPVVRLLRQVRHVHLAEMRPGGLYFEVLAFYAWRDGDVTGDSWAELLTSTLEKVAARLRDASTSGLLDPILNRGMKPELTSAQWDTAAGILEQLAQLAQEALESEPCRAAQLWRRILGENDRGQVLPLPQGCGANGYPINNVSAVRSVGSDDPRGFA